MRLPFASVRAIAGDLTQATRAYARFHRRAGERARRIRRRYSPAGDSGVLPRPCAGDRRPAARLLRIHSADSSRHAAAGDHQRHRHEPGGVRLVLRPHGRAGRRSVRALGAVSSRSASSAISPADCLYAFSPRARRHDDAGAVAVWSLAAAVAAVVWVLGALAAVGCTLLLALAMVPRSSPGIRALGRRHAAGWIAGTLLGYASPPSRAGRSCSCGVAALPWFTAAWRRACAFDMERHYLDPPTPAAPCRALDEPGTQPRCASCCCSFRHWWDRPSPKIARGRRGGQSPLPRLLHCRLRLAHGAGREMTKHAQPPAIRILASRAGPLLLDLLSRAGDASPATPIGRGAGAEAERAGRAALLFISAIYLAAWTAVPRIRSRSLCRGADDRRGERGGARGHRRSDPARPVRSRDCAS